jgi:hypothetical protein
MNREELIELVLKLEAGADEELTQRLEYSESA